jgi:hypothetical protein
MALFITIIISSSFLASAICPICTIAVAGGAGLLRYYGVDDLLTGLWAGALLLSISLWFLTWLDKKAVKFKFRNAVSILAIYAISIIPLYFTNMFNNPLNKIMGIDRLLFGIIIGTLVFYFAVLSDKHLRKLNDSKVVFPYQKVIIPLVYLIIASIIIHLLVGML